MSKSRRPVTVFHNPCSPNRSGTRFSVNLTLGATGRLCGVWATSAAVYWAAMAIRQSRSHAPCESAVAATPFADTAPINSAIRIPAPIFILLVHILRIRPRRMHVVRHVGEDRLDSVDL